MRLVLEKVEEKLVLALQPLASQPAQAPLALALMPQALGLELVLAQVVMPQAWARALKQQVWVLQQALAEAALVWGHEQPTSERQPVPEVQQALAPQARALLPQAWVLAAQP